MTEKKKIIVRRKVAKLSAGFFIAILVLTVSCKKETTTVGDGLEGSSLGIAYTDTFTLETYTEKVDSVETDETAVNLLGAYVDPVFGKVDCGIVAQMRLSSSNPVFGPVATMVMDSVVLALRYGSINYYGNIQPMTFEVYQISDELDRENEYYTFSSATPLGPNIVETGSETVLPDIVSEQIVGEDTLPAHLRVRLDPSFGMALANANASGLMSTDDEFVDNFKGLYIKVNGTGLVPSQGTILYTVLENSISGVTIYFHDSGDGIKKQYTFEFNSVGTRFNDIKFDRTGTDVADAIADQSLGKQTFYAQGSSLRGVIKVPYLLNFNYDSLGNWDPKIINKAELVLPVQDFTEDVFDASAKLFIAKIVDDRYSTTTMDYSGSGTSLLAVNYDDDNKEYRFTVTREIQGMLSGERDFNGFRVYSPSFFGSTIERIVFNGSATTLKEKPRLEIRYTNY